MGVREIIIQEKKTVFYCDICGKDLDNELTYHNHCRLCGKTMCSECANKGLQIDVSIIQPTYWICPNCKEYRKSDVDRLYHLRDHKTSMEKFIEKELKEKRS